MAKYLKIFLAVIALTTIFNVGVSYADTDPSAGFAKEACSGLTQISNTTQSCTSTGQDTLKTVATTVVEIISILIGIVSVIVLIFAGFRFITANGDSNNISAARNMIIYAIVGLVIAVLAQLIVREVTNTASSIQQHSFLNSQSIIRNDS